MMAGSSKGQPGGRAQDRSNRVGQRTLNAGCSNWTFVIVRTALVARPYPCRQNAMILQRRGALAATRNVTVPAGFVITVAVADK